MGAACKWLDAGVFALVQEGRVDIRADSGRIGGFQEIAVEPNAARDRIGFMA